MALRRSQCELMRRGRWGEWWGESHYQFYYQSHYHFTNFEPSTSSRMELLEFNFPENVSSDFLTPLLTPENTFLEENYLPGYQSSYLSTEKRIFSNIWPTNLSSFLWNFQKFWKNWKRLWWPSWFEFDIPVGPPIQEIQTASKYEMSRGSNSDKWFY